MESAAAAIERLLSEGAFETTRAGGCELGDEPLLWHFDLLSEDEARLKRPPQRARRSDLSQSRQLNLVERSRDVD